MRAVRFFVPMLLALARAASADDVSLVAGERLHVESTGRGPAVVLIPGLMGSAYGFRRVVGPLVDAGHRVLVVEPLGIGRSARPERADYSLTAQADRVAGVLDRLQTGPAILAAHSVGASIAMRVACRHPGRVTRSADPGWVTEEVVDGYLAGPAQDLGAALRAFGQMARAEEPELLAPRLSTIRCPVRLLIGTATREGGISAAEIELLRREVRSFSVETVPDAGNFVFEERPLAVVAAVAQSAQAVRLAGGALP
jgi:pimeloyl-ACP methyl ester carboxylesterase